MTTTTVKDCCDALAKLLTTHAEHGARLCREALRELDDVDAGEGLPVSRRTRSLAEHLDDLRAAYDALALRIEEEADGGGDVMGPGGEAVDPGTVRLEGRVAAVMPAEWIRARAEAWRELGEHHVVLLGIGDGDEASEPGA